MRNNERGQASTPYPSALQNNTQLRRLNINLPTTAFNPHIVTRGATVLDTDEMGEMRGITFIDGRSMMLVRGTNVIDLGTSSVTYGAAVRDTHGPRYDTADAEESDDAA